MIRLYKSAHFLIFIALFLAGCGAKPEIEKFHIVYKCLYDGTSTALEKEKKPYSKILVTKVTNDAVVQCEQKFEDLFQYAFYEVSKTEENKCFSTYINIVSYYFTGHFIFDVNDKIDESTKEKIRTEFKNEFVHFYMSRNEKY